jgi:succinyl-CoA synthetase beta subunit
MNIHEYQGKTILSGYNVKVPVGTVASNSEEAVRAANFVKEKTGADTWAIKAQIHAGGRGKGGGIKIAHSLPEVEQFASEILGMNLITAQTGSHGKIVRKVLVEQGIYYKGVSSLEEYYLSILLDRTKGRNVIVYSRHGGMEIEAVAEKDPESLFKEDIDPVVGLQSFQSRKIAFSLGLEGKAFNEFMIFLPALYKAYIASDATLFEINPLVKTSDNCIIAADAKIVLDDNSLFRHPEFVELRDLNEEDASETEASRHGLNFVKLDGNVGCMVNGAGLAMATMDIIKLSGGSPANFLDVGGSANAITVEAGFRIILADPNVEAILINIFGGIVRCDRVAQGVIDAYKAIGDIKIPIITRLQGTNAEEAKTLIDYSGLKVKTAVTFQQAADLVRAALETF